MVVLSSHSPFLNVYRYAPLPVYVSPLRSHVNDPQAVAVVSVCTPVVISRFSVMLSSHSPFTNVYRYSPVSVYVSPLRSHVNDPQAVAVVSVCTPVPIVTSIVVSTAHCPSSGVNVNADVPTVVVMIAAGFHLPVMPLFDVNGNSGAVAFRQSCPIASKTGTIASDMVSISVMLSSHSPFIKVYRYSPLSVYVSPLRSHVK